MIKNFIEYLQSRPHHTKNKIVAGVLLVTALVLSTLWFNNIEKRLAGLDTENLLDQGQVLSATNYVSVESAENKDGKTYIHFKINNNTPDILNAPSRDKIKLLVDDRTLTPDRVLDRQQMPFVVKVLNNSTAYGTLVFEEITENNVEIRFENMYFENSPSSQAITERLNVDLDELEPVQELRS